MKKETELSLTVLIPFILTTFCAILILSEPAQSDRILIVITLFILSSEITRLNSCIKKFKKLAHEQNQEFEAILKHEFKIPAIAQIRAIELLLSGHIGKFSGKQKKFFCLMLESEKILFELINSKILKYSQKIDMLSTIK